MTNSPTPLPNIEQSQQRDAQRFAFLLGPEGKDCRRKLLEHFRHASWTLNDWRSYIDMEMIRYAKHHVDVVYVLDNSTVEVLTDNLKLREMLALSASGRNNLYGDDGELQDGASRPYIDYLRDSVDDIHKKLEERAETKLKALFAPPQTNDPNVVGDCAEDCTETTPPVRITGKTKLQQLLENCRLEVQIENVQLPPQLTASTYLPVEKALIVNLVEIVAHVGADSERVVVLSGRAVLERH